MSDENPVRFVPEVFGLPDPPAPAPLPLAQAAAQAEIDRIFADRSHPYHQGNEAAVGEMLRLHRVRHPPDQPGPNMEVGSFVPFQIIGKPLAPTLTVDQAQAEIARAYSDRSYWDAPGAVDRMNELLRIVSGKPPEEAPDPNAPPATPAASFIASAADLGLSEAEAKEWVRWAEAQPSGGTLQQALIGWPEDAHDEVTELADLAWKNLPLKLSARAAAELHGVQYGERAFRDLVKRGLEIQEAQEAEALRLRESRPGDARLNDPARRQRY